MTPVLVRPARDVDAADLAVLAALDSARPLTGEILIAVSGGEVAAAMSIDTGAVVANPFLPTAHLVELLRTAARPAPAPPRRAPRRFALRAVRAPRQRRPRPSRDRRAGRHGAVAPAPLGRVERLVGLGEQRRAVDRRRSPTPRRR